MALKTPYCTVTEADTYLEGSVIWEAAEDEEKDDALFWARVYFDQNYTCLDLDETDLSDEVKYANALLAEDHLEETLIETSDSLSGKIKKESKKLGPLAKSIEYANIGLANGDAQQNVTLLIADECTKNNSGEVSLERT